MTTQTKADRQAAAKKAAATRERNRTREESKERGTKAAATRQGNQAAESVDRAKQSARSAGGGLKAAARSVGDAAKQAGSSVPVIAKIRCTAGGPGTIANRRPRPAAALLASIAARSPDESMNVTPPRSSTIAR